MSLCNLGTQVGSKFRAADGYQLNLSSSAVLSSAPEHLFQLEIFCQCKFCSQREHRRVQLDQLTFETQTKPSSRPPRSNFKARGSAAVLGWPKPTFTSQFQGVGSANRHLCSLGLGPADLGSTVTGTRPTYLHCGWNPRHTSSHNCIFDKLSRVYEMEFSLASCFMLALAWLSEIRQLLMQCNTCQHRVHPAAFFRTLLRSKSDFTLDCLALHHSAIMFWSSVRNPRAGFTVPPNHSFCIPVTNWRQRGQWLISCCLQSTLRPTEKSMAVSDKHHLLFSELVVLYFAVYLWP